jgi:predicted small lipoprotein YifL
MVRPISGATITMTACGTLLSRLALAGVLITALALGACGRKGPLEPPPSAAAAQSGENGQPPAKQPDKKLLIDGLLN